MAQGEPGGASGEDRSGTTDVSVMAMLRSPGALLAALKQNKPVAGLVGAGLVILIAVLSWGLGDDQDDGPEASYEQALAELEANNLEEAERLANLLREKPDQLPEQLTGPLYVAGVVASLRAEPLYGDDRQYYFLQAIRLLEESRDRGFPPGRESHGNYVLGRSMFMTGHYGPCRPFLRAALRNMPDEATDLHRLLADAELASPNPDYNVAMEHNTYYLESESLTESQRHEGLLQRSQILLRLGRPEDSRQVLNEIPAQSSVYVDAVLMGGRILLDKADQLREQAEAAQDDEEADGTPLMQEALQAYEQAIAVLRRAKADGAVKVSAARQAGYLVGLCYLGLNDPQAALSSFQLVQTQFPETPEGLASTLAEADLLHALGQPEEALDAYQRALRSAGDPRAYGNRWIPLDDFRRRVLAAHELYRSQGMFRQALRLGESLYPMFPRLRILELEAETHSDWGTHLLELVDSAPDNERRELQSEGRSQFRKAGLYYYQLGQQRIASLQYPNDIWNAAEAQLSGQDYFEAIKLLDHYLEVEAIRRRPLALLKLGKAMMSLGQFDQALPALQECVEFYPRDPASYDARLAAARVHMEKNNLAEGQTLLLEILDGQHLTPASHEWKMALFTLGELFYQAQQYDEAILRLEEAIGRYQDDPHRVKARYLTGNSYHQLAEELRIGLSSASADSARRAKLQRIRTLNEQALQQYTALMDELLPLDSVGRLTPLQSDILRNCYFARGSVYFQMEQYPEAIDAYANATHRYQQSPEVLEAYVQISNCYRRMNQLPKARDTLEQAKVILSRIKPEVAFADGTNFTRAEWSERLDWLINL